MRITRPFVLLALAVLLAPRIEAARTSVWESNPPAAAVLTSTSSAGLLAPLAPVGSLESIVADVEPVEPLRFDLGDVVLVENPLGDGFRIGLADVVEPALRGPPALNEDPHQAFELRDPETRIRGFELLPPFRVGASPSLSLWSRQACGFVCREVVSDSRYDPWGLYSWGDFKRDVTDTGKSFGGFLSQALLEGNGVYQLYNTARTAKALAGRTKELYRKGGASAVANAAITEVASSLPIVNTIRNASRIVDTYEKQGAFEGGRQVFRTTKAAATDVAAVYGIGKAATAPEPSVSIVPEGGWSFPRVPAVVDAPSPSGGIGKGEPARFGSATSTDYRETFFEAFPETRGKVWVHHAVERQAVETRFPGVASEAELHSLENLRGIPKEINPDIHLGQIRKIWNEFYRQSPNPTKEQLLDQATKIDDTFGDRFTPPVR